ncbi:MAG TPA: thioredoxin [Methanomassiliicoccales archaeon]|nr:thioredoxin [Methanomassiliicoccales archaeon]
MPAHILEITKDNFEAMAKEHPKLVIDCWADWCGPCRRMGPIFEKVAEESSGKAAFGKMDCDRNKELVKRFKIMAIPTLLLIKEGEVADSVVGLVPKEEIEAALRKVF